MKSLVRKILSLLIVAAVAGSCSGTGSEQSEVLIRIENKSEHTIENIVVGFPDREVVFGDLEAGSQSEYKEVGRAYRYAFISAKVGTLDVALVPVDYVGEQLLDGGQYTYALNIDGQLLSDESPYALLFDFEED